jgi:hypothetical protein
MPESAAKKKLQNGARYVVPELLTDIAGDLAEIRLRQDLRFCRLCAEQVEVTEYNFNWKTFIGRTIWRIIMGPFHRQANLWIVKSQLGVRRLVQRCEDCRRA